MITITLTKLTYFTFIKDLLNKNFQANWKTLYQPLNIQVKCLDSIVSLQINREKLMQ